MQEEKTKDYLEGAFYGIPIWVVWVYATFLFLFLHQYCLAPMVTLAFRVNIINFVVTSAPYIENELIFKDKFLH